MDEQTPRSLKLGIGMLTALLWLAALGVAAYWTMRFLDNSKPAPANAREAAVPPPQALNWPALSTHFGAEQKAAVATDVKVLGIVLPPTNAKARAVLMVESTKATVVAEVGKEIADGPLQGAVIERITPTQVMLNRSNGNTQALAVPDAKDAKNSGLVTFTPTSTQPLVTANSYIPNIPGNSISAATLNAPNAPNGMNPQNASMAAAQAARAAAQSAQEAQMQQPAQIPPPAPVQEPGVVTTRQLREQR